MMPLRKQTGFTIAEILVALVVFALMGAAATTALLRAQEDQSRLLRSGDRLGDLQRAITLFSRDIQQLTTRRVRDELGGPIPALRLASDGSGQVLEFTTSGWRNPTKLPRSNLQHLLYRVDEEQLKRYHWWYLDRANAEPPFERSLMAGVKQWRIEVLSDDDQWRQQWPLSDEQQSALPRAIKVVFELEGRGEITRLYPLWEVPAS